ncbi:MAG: glycosyltransferase, partial [Pirellulales bacterium]
ATPDRQLPLNKALILSPFFFPEPISTGKYNTYLAQSLRNEGFEVEVMCCHPVYPKWEVESTNDQLEGVLSIRGGQGLKFPSNMLLRRLILELWYLQFVLFNYWSRRNIYNVVIPIFPPSMFMLAISLLKPKKAKVVGIVHDLQGVYSSYTGGYVRKWIYRCIALVEKRAFKACDHLIFLSEGMRKVASEAYALKRETSSVQYPFVTIEKFENNGDLADLIPDGEQAIVYSGALGEKQSPENLMKLFLFLLEAKAELKAHIFSQGPIYERLKETHRHPRLQFHSLVKEEMLPELLMRSTVQVIPQESGSSDGSLPSKLPNLLAAGTKILCITDPDSELAQIIGSYSQGGVATSWEMKPLVQIASDLLEKDGMEYRDGDHVHLKQFTRQGLVGKIKAVV